ncbi:hypothetical protein HPB50_024657 [Hyalomma asiaticum]|uniref:Uncharacterized protein n=1 Tax=Hyalomma asiaticum TaxID=266040 RepID=A0ACB7RKM6_HYAAI|nr:hypothetical protein HPB50_024657 [Hyalomma asiaticum]
MRDIAGEVAARSDARPSTAVARRGRVFRPAGPLGARPNHARGQEKALTFVKALLGLHNLVYKRAPDIAKELGDNVRKLIVIIGELATSLEKVSDVPPTDWMGVGDTIVSKTEKLNLAEIAPFWSYIPKMKDFQCVKLLGAGGFGAVYKAIYKPTNLVCTIKLVPCDKFQRHKQACVDKVTASIIRNPFLVKYYACYCTRDAYLTVMEYICGADLFRVVEKAVYLPTNECRIVMAQLILALEHMHLRGLLHRDIKVSNMLIIPGGRVKVIDFDTNKVCVGHYSKRVCRGYFNKTALEFRDGECAGTVPYMAPEIIKHRPYGRACDWWSAGATFYKMMTGRVPFRAEDKEVLKDKIANEPLKWPKVEVHPHSATPEAKDMVFKMLKKNPSKKSAGPVQLKESFFDTSGAESATLDYKKASDTDVIAGISAYSGTGVSADKSITAKERMDVILFRTKSLGKYWSFGVNIVEVEGENNRRFFIVDKVKSGSPAQVSHVLEGDVIVAVNGQDVAQLPIGEVRRRMQDSGDQLVLTVLSSSAFRMLESRRDMDEVLKAAGKDTIQLRAIHTTCGGSGNYGFTVFEAKAWNEKKKALVHCHVIQKKVKSGSPAQVSHVLEGDVIVAVNGQDVAQLPIGEVRRRMQDSGDQLVLTVLSSSAFRMLESRRDMDEVLKAAGKDTIQLRAIHTTCGGSGNYGFTVFEAKAWNEKKKALVHCHVIQKVNNPQILTPNKFIYPGDVLLMVDGVTVDTMDQYGIKSALARGANEINITIAPMSPLRVKRPSFTRLHETVMTDEHVPEPSAKALIEPPKT